MHANLSITDGVYGILSETDVRKKIAELGQRIGNLQEDNIESLMVVIRRVEALLLKQEVLQDA